MLNPCFVHEKRFMWGTSINKTRFILHLRANKIRFLYLAVQFFTFLHFKSLLEHYSLILFLCSIQRTLLDYYRTVLAQSSNLDM